ncbi:hypothetical protein [Pseudomonas sp. GL-RE-26]|uniref:hypothetical protein n=1 Tax=Pseudomonas sp. GL-RE-26 TaxID=2832390 RepID=UPI001CBE5257|nr:hypothetical protein [Pseudomonas sp. GL-RE-26]
MNVSLDKAVQGLLDLHLTRGVQPSDLADNLFDVEYTDYSLKKRGSILILDLSYQEELEDSFQKICMRYTYSAERYLVKIEQRVGLSKFSVQWCRSIAIASAVADVTQCLSSAGLSGKAISKVLDTLPQDLIDSIGERLKLVA